MLLLINDLPLHPFSYLSNRRYAMLALGNLLLSSSTHESLIATGLMPVAISCLYCDDEETKFFAAYSLNKLAMNDVNLEAMGRSGMIVPLIKLIKSDHEHTKIHSISCLRRLARLAENRIAIVAGGALDGLTKAGKQKNVELQREVAACLSNLALSDQNRKPMATVILIMVLLSLCQSDDEECARLACGALASIAENTGTHPVMIKQCNSLHHLIFLMRNKHVSIHREAARAVSNILSTEAFHENFLYEDGLRSLFIVSRSKERDCQFLAAMIFRKLSPVISNHDTIIAKGGLQPLIGLLQLQVLFFLPKDSQERFY